MSLYLGTNLISGVATPVEGARNIGQIVQSTIPLTDAGLHLLDGGIIQRGSYADFVDYMAGLVSTYPDLFTTESAWQTAVTTYGVCGKFVYDSVNNTVRLPKYSDKIWSGGGIANSKGNGIALGLTDGTNNGGAFLATSQSIVLTNNYGDDVGTAYGGTTYNTNKTIGVTTDATKSGIITDLSTITTALDGYWYIVLATSTKTDIEVDIDEVMTDLNSKADIADVWTPSTSTQAQKEMIVSWGAPDYSSLISIATLPYTAPSDGYIFIWTSRGQDQTSNVKVNGTQVCYSISYWSNISYTFPVAKGDIISTNNSTLDGKLFIPLKGAN